jgi:hypothetical protein
VAAGAAEVDMVVSVGSLKEGDGPASRVRGAPSNFWRASGNIRASTQRPHTF